MNLQMGLVLLLSTAAYISIGIAVGVRLTRLARRTGGFPERMLGISCLAGPGLVAPCMVVVHAVPEPEWLVRAAALLGQFGYSLFCSVMVLFTWQCFRPEERWARWLARTSIAVVVFAGSAGALRALGLASPAELKDMNHWGFRMIGIASLVGHVWTGLESFSYWSRMRKRMGLGLADPIVTNRFLLWGLVAVNAIIASGVPLVVGFLGGDSFNDVPTRLAGAAATIAGSVALQLAFLPPQSYVAWLKKRAAAAA
jgi:hypothetical protein